MVIPMSYPDPGMSVPITTFADMTSTQPDPETAALDPARCPRCDKSLAFPATQADGATSSQLIDACGCRASEEGGDWWSGIRVPG